MSRRLEIGNADCWTCAWCGALNATGRRECGVCYAPKSHGRGPGTQNTDVPGTDTGAASKRAPRAVLPGHSWLCDACGTHNADGRHYCASCRAVQTSAPAKRAVPGAKLTKTEERYRRDILEPRLDGFDLREIRRPGLVLYTPGGHRYTPDFCCIRHNGDIEIHEVKGAYRLGSYQRARCVFDEIRIAWPQFRYYWATWTGKEWAVE